MASENNVDSEKFLLPVKYNKIYEFIGWGGSILVLIAYIVPIKNFTYFMFNILGAFGLIISCINKKAYQPIVVNIIWIIGTFYKYFK
jgi:hypothetical protein